MAVTHQLARLTTRNRKAEAIDNVVQTPLQLLQQQFAGDALAARRLLEVVAELAFLREVHALRLLLFAKLQAVAHDLGLAIFTVLARSEITFFDRTLVRKALCAFEEQLHALAAAKAAYCVFVSCQVYSPQWIVVSGCGQQTHLLLSDRFTGLGVPSSRSKISCQWIVTSG